MKKAAFVIGGMLLVGIIAYLIARAMSSKQVQAPPALPTPLPDTKGATMSAPPVVVAAPTPAVEPPVVAATTATVTPITPVRKLYRHTNGKSYIENLPGLFSNIEVIDGNGNVAADPIYNDYYFYYIPPPTTSIQQKIMATRWSGTDAAFISFKPGAAGPGAWIMNRNFNLISGAF